MIILGYQKNKTMIIHRSMDNLTLMELELILLTYDAINVGNVNEEQIQLAFDVLPVKNSGMSNLARMKAINQYVIFNNEDLLNMRTTLINNQSDQNEQTGTYALESPAKVIKPRAKRKSRTKSRSKARGRKK